MKFQFSPVSVLKSEEKLKLLRFLIHHESAMSGREIASLLKISHMSVNRAMQEFVSMNFVQYVTVGKAHVWKVNRKSYAYKILRQLVECLREIPDPLSELKAVVMKYLSKHRIEKVVLFGSIARKEDRPDSDIDLFIVVKNKEGQKKIEATIEKMSNDCLEIFGNRFSPYILTVQQFKQKQRLPLMAEINKGIQIFPKEKRR